MTSASDNPAQQREAVEKAMAVYACALCTKMFKKAGMCPDCNRVLKKAAS